MKYLLTMIIAFVLWLTAPMWMNHHSRTVIDPSIRESLRKNEAKGSIPLTEEEKNLSAFIRRYGPKPKRDYNSDTPYAVRSYWKKRYKNPEAIEELRCTIPQKSSRGWRTVCDYRTNERDEGRRLKQSIYYISNGHVSE
jgi:hypothetical protein